MSAKSLARAAALALSLLAPAAMADGGPPVFISHSGRILGGDDQPLDRPTDVTLTFFSAREGGTGGWTATYSVNPLHGVYNVVLGETTGGKPALTAGDVAGEKWLEVKIGGQAMSPRMRLGTVPSAAYAENAKLFANRPVTDFALNADLAAVAKSGAYADLTGTPDLTPYAKSAALAKVATTGAYADLVGGPDLTPYAKSASLSKVATTGAYADLIGGPDLAPYAKSADLSRVATTGAFGDLTGKPSFAALGTECAPGLVLKGLNADGSYSCVNPIDAKNLPADGIDEISNGLVNNQFTDSVSGGTGVKIPDNNPVGVSDTIDFPDIGIAQGLTVTVDLSNSNTSTLKVSLFDPANAEHVLFNGGSAGTSLKATYPTPVAPVTGNLGAWVNRNPKGKWFLKVVDTGFLNNAFDGQINSWSVNVKTLSNRKIRIAGNLTADGSIQVGADTAACDASKRGALRMDDTYGLETCNGTDWIAAVPKPIIWSGGCTSHSIGAGEDTYCLNGIDNNSAAKYLDVATNGIVTIKLDGYYRINAWMDGTSCSYRRIILRTTPNGGSERDMAYSHNYNSSTGWYQLQMDQTFPFRKGDKFRIVSQNDCNSYRWHSWNPLGQHSRAQFSFVGPLAN